MVIGAGSGGERIRIWGWGFYRTVPHKIQFASKILYAYLQKSIMKFKASLRTVLTVLKR